jgi:assimilatory nitrate reductase catalytic subunit
MHRPEPFVEVHPADARAAGLVDGAFARISTAHGACIMKVIVSDDQQAGSLFVPIHWSDATASCSRVGDLVAPHTDPHSGQPEAKATPAAIAPVSFSLRGFVRTRHPLTFPQATWWARAAVAQCIEYRLATSLGPLHWHDFAQRVFAGRGRFADRLAGGTYSAGAFVDDELHGCLCVGPVDEPLQFALSTADGPDEDGLASARRLHESIRAAEPVVCACFQVKLDSVRKAIVCGETSTLVEIGKKLRAGTNCGSCIAELKRLIKHERLAATQAPARTRLE